MLQLEPRIATTNRDATFAKLEKLMARSVYDASPDVDRARRVAKALGLGGGFAPARNALAKGASDFYSSNQQTVSLPAEPRMPSPKDVSVLHDDAVNPDLRSAIIEASKRRQRMGDAAWAQSVEPLRDAIDDLVDRLGVRFGALHRLLGSSANNGKFAKGADSLAERNRALEKLLHLPKEVRQTIWKLKSDFDGRSAAERRAYLAHPRTVAALQRIEEGFGTEAAAAVRAAIA